MDVTSVKISLAVLIINTLGFLGIMSLGIVHCRVFHVLREIFRGKKFIFLNMLLFFFADYFLIECSYSF